MRPRGLSTAFSPAFVMAALALISITKAAGADEKVIHNFISNPHGANPVGNLIADGPGNFYGTTRNGGEHGYGAIFQLARRPDGRWVETVLHSFNGGNEGLIPNGGLTFDRAGNLYGTTFFGGEQACSDGCGLVFELAQAAPGKWNFSVIYRFKGRSDGDNPNGGVVFDGAGNMYGTTNGNYVNGAVYELVRSSTGWSEKTLYNFGASIPVNLAIDAGGALYGVLWPDGPVGIFRLAGGRDGKWTEDTLCGCAANGIPVFDPVGNLYIGTNNQILELVRNRNWTTTVIAQFDGSDGYYAAGALTFDENGNLYGTTSGGGDVDGCPTFGCGTAFKLTLGKNGQWQHNVLYKFKGNRDGVGPSAGVIFDPGGNLYGTTQGGGDPGACNNGPCGTVFELVSTSDGHWKHSAIYRFALGDSSGSFGLAGVSGLIADSSGNLYGAAVQGPSGCGMVYQLTRSGDAGWKERILYQFKCGTGDGMQPLSGLIFDSAGNLYGTTSEGGTSCAPPGCGTVYELSPDSNGAWTERVLYNFTDNGDGGYPVGGLVFDNTGNLYGTTEIGGNYDCGDSGGYPIGCGVVYELSPASQGSWTETSLHTFLGFPSDGAFPAAALIFDQAGNLYGTTSEGGGGPCYDGNDNQGCGTAFRLSPGSGGVWTETVLYNVPGGVNDSSAFITGLTMAQGNLYGLTYGSGTSAYCPYGCGTVYKLSPGSGGRWTATVLYNFGGSKDDGSYPVGAVTFDKSGNLYGTTFWGGGSSSCINGCGTVFQLSPSSRGSWTEKVFYGFSGPYKDSAGPTTGVIFDGAGNLYGTTNYGGVDNGLYTGGGTIFEVIP